MSLLLLGGSSILLAAFLAGVVGFAYGLVALPLLLVMGVPLADAVVINLAVALVTRLAVIARGYRDIQPMRATLLVLGSAPGVGIGLAAREAVPSVHIQLVAGVLTLVAVVAMLRRDTRRPTSPAGPRLTFTAGTLGGFLGVTTSLNGVPPALLLTGDRAPARNMVADLAAYFVAGNALTLTAIVVAGQAPAGRVWWALAGWIPLGLLGNLGGTHLGPLLPYVFFRRLTLAIIVVSGVVCLLQAGRSLL